MQNAPREHSAILSTFIKLPFVFKTFVLSIFEWPLKTNFSVVVVVVVVVVFVVVVVVVVVEVVVVVVVEVVVVAAAAVV